MNGGIWEVALPKVYRYENQIWIDEFFETGKLRLTTFKKFANYEDEERGDNREGIVFAANVDSQNKQTITAFGGLGISCLVLCCSTLFDDSLNKAFDRDSAFVIRNTTNFAYEVSRALSGFRLGLEGHCIYENDAAFLRDYPFDLEKFRNSDGDIDMSKIMGDISANMFGREALLLKRIKYEHQREYRLLWQIDEVKQDHVDIICPRAVQFCQRMKK